MGDHPGHKTCMDSECDLCEEIAYEPSWYASLLAFGKEPRDGVITWEPRASLVPEHVMTSGSTDEGRASLDRRPRRASDY